MSWSRFVVAILAAGNLFAVFVRAAGFGAEDMREVVKKLQARYEQTRDLSADFKQTTKIEGFATPILSSGRMYIKKPGRLRWDYADPNVEEIYVNQNDVKMYVPEHKQVLIGKLTQMAASQAPLQLLQGAAKLEEQYVLDQSRAGDHGEGGLPLISLLPKPDGNEACARWYASCWKSSPRRTLSNGCPFTRSAGMSPPSNSPT